MMAAEAGIGALLIKSGAWIVAGGASLLAAALGWIIKEKNATIQDNKKAVSEIKQQITELAAASEARDHRMEEMFHEIQQLSGVKDRTLVMETELKNTQGVVAEIKADIKQLLNKS